MDNTYRERIEWHSSTNAVTLMASIDSEAGPPFRFGYVFEPEDCVPGEDYPLPACLATARLALKWSYDKWSRDANSH